jgi:hypothetical protein
MGLNALGHEVYFVEDSDDYPSCSLLSGGVTTDPSYGLDFAFRTFAQVGLEDRWAYYDAHTSRWIGPCEDRIVGICENADVLLNLSGMNPIRPWLEGITVRVLVDTDPLFTQVNHLTNAAALQMAQKHNAFFSFGENIGHKTSTVPDDGLPWQSTRQPVVLKAWPVKPGNDRGKFTTVMQWDSYPARQYNGHRYGMKSDSFTKFINLPTKAGPIFELAVNGTPPRLLVRKGWSVRDALVVTRDAWTYQAYIHQSKGEFSLAKHGYVVSRSGCLPSRHQMKR